MHPLMDLSQSLMWIEWAAGKRRAMLSRIWKLYQKQYLGGAKLDEHLYQLRQTSCSPPHLIVMLQQDRMNEHSYSHSLVLAWLNWNVQVVWTFWPGWNLLCSQHRGTVSTGACEMDKIREIASQPPPQIPAGRRWLGRLELLMYVRLLCWFDGLETWIVLRLWCELSDFWIIAASCTILPGQICSKRKSVFSAS